LNTDTGSHIPTGPTARRPVQARQLSARVVSTAQVMPGVYLLWLWAPYITELCTPGQFVMVRCGGGLEPLLRRPLSIHRTASEEQIALLFSVVGRGTFLLSQQPEGGEVDLLGPLGNGFSLDSGSRRVLLIAGGMGIAPLVFLADEAARRGLEVVLLMGAATADCLYPGSLLPSSVTVVKATEDGSAGRRGQVTDVIDGPAGQADQVFACGPMSMYQAMIARESLRGRSVQVSLEVAMACGLGACYGCSIKTRKGLRQVCRDGPVFELEDLF